MRYFPAVFILLFGLPLSLRASAQDLNFKDVSVQSGISYTHGYKDGLTTDQRKAIGGVAVADVDSDGFLDLYAVRGDVGPNLLFRNKGDGTFENIAAEAGVDLVGNCSGPVFADFTGDGRPDLLVGGIEETKPRLFRNVDGTHFEDITEESGIVVQGDTFSGAFGDYDRDGDLDLFLAHWMGSRPAPTESTHLWRNQGDGTFEPVPDQEAGLTGFVEKDFSLTPTFADINNDGWPDILLAADFGTSKIFLNQQDGTFLNTTTDVISDENGMGSAVADYDNDGDLDWFVSSIWDPDPIGFGWGVTGNRLYRNHGNGTFEDVTDEAGVRQGYWGWAACFADFNNDSNVDLFHVNGFYPLDRTGNGAGSIFLDDPSPLFLSNGDGTFQQASMGLTDRGQGRGLVCFDYDKDGDVDIFAANNSQGPSLFRNDSEQGHFITIRLGRPSPDTPVVGTRVSVTAAGKTQMKEIHAGSSYVSQQPEELHFGLGTAKTVDVLRITWPDGVEEVYHNVAVDQHIQLRGTIGNLIDIAGNRLIYPHAPQAGGLESELILINTNHSQSAVATVRFFDPSGSPRVVSVDGLGSNSIFTIELPAGSSHRLKMSAAGPLGLGMAEVAADLPVDGLWQFQIDQAHVGVLPAQILENATIPVVNSGGLATAVAISNPTSQPVSITLSLVDTNGSVLEEVRPPELNPLVSGGQVARFLDELGVGAAIGATVQMTTTQGDGFSALALVTGGESLSAAPVTTGVAGTFSFAEFSGSYRGPEGTRLLAAALPGVRMLSLNFDLTGLRLVDKPLETIQILGSYAGGHFEGFGFSEQLGKVSLTISSEGLFYLEATQPLTEEITSLRLEGTAFPDRFDIQYRVEIPGSAAREGTITWMHTGN